jgi:broad specificity phosphatase PhoE
MTRRPTLALVALLAACLASLGPAGPARGAGVAGSSVREAAAGAANPAKPARDPLAVTYIVVRHAEKDTTGTGDVPLSAAGERRANELARMLADAHVTRIYATPTRRAMETGAPAARAIGDSVRVVDGTAGLLKRLRAQRPGDVVLVVGHTNTVPEIVEGLSGRRVPPFGDGEYDRMIVVVVTRPGAATVVTLRYGEQSQPLPGDRMR